MNLYIHDLSLLDSGDFSDPFLDRFSLSHLNPSPSSWSSSASSAPSPRHDTTATDADQNPPPHRYDGTSPLPLGMDWTPYPQHPVQSTVWPEDTRKGWSYWVTIPSWTLMTNSSGSNPTTFYRVQVGLQSPNVAASATTREILRRFSDFLKLQSDLQKEFPLRKMPPAPPKRILKVQSKTLLEERRCSLENWIEQLLSDIYVSRSAAVGIFLELEASVRSFFDGVHEDSNSSVSDVAPPILSQIGEDLYVPSNSSFIASDYCNDLTEEISGGEATRERSDNNGNRTSEDKAVLSSGITSLLQFENHKPDFNVYRHFVERSLRESTSVDASEISNLVVDNGEDDFLEGAEITDVTDSSNVRLQDGLLVAFPSYERQNLNRVLDKVVQRVAIAKTDIEDLMGRFNKEVAVKQFLMMRVKDLEADLETTKDSCKENMQQAALKERERFTQMQWDIEELKNRYFEKEMNLEFEQAQREHEESLKNSLIKENETLLKQFGTAKEELENMCKQLEEVELKSKTEVKLLVKEVKSLRGSNSELRQELTCFTKEKEDLESALLKEREEKAKVTTANVKLLHECEILCDRLQQCSVNFLIGEKNKIIVDSSSSPSDAIDLLETSDSRIGLLLAEAQLLVDEAGTSAPVLNVNGDGGVGEDATDKKLRKMLAETFINYARSKMEVNSVIRCALNATAGMDSSEFDASEEETPKERTALSKILDK
ncbi:unnamed protein product [Linum trigynum]|uniref:PX domain-containing protein n=1 Tax=Linum trigynum TaxID=586398 RepID=A0AAV2DVZ4_9ROSI